MNAAPHFASSSLDQTLLEAIECLKSSQLDQAQQLAEEVLQKQPGREEGLYVLALVAYAKEQFESAKRFLEQLLSLNPTNPGYLAYMADTLALMEDYHGAERHYQAALSLQPQDVEALVNLGRTQVKLQRLDEAVRSFSQALTLRPDHPDNMRELAVCLSHLGRMAPALNLLEKAVKLDPESGEVHHSYAFALLKDGRYPEGWQEMTWRFKSNHYRKLHGAQFQHPFWEGNERPDIHLMLICEQGFGDVIQMIRYAPLVAEKVGRLSIYTTEELERLMGAIPGVDYVAIDSRDPVLGDVSHCLPTLHLPLVFETTPETIPSTKGLFVLSEQERGAASSLPDQKMDDGRLRIGLVWTGKSHQGFQFEYLAPLLALEGPRFYSLQYGPAGDLVTGHPGIADLRPLMGDFADTAGLIREMDLVISTDTAVAHLAGTLGVETWVMLHEQADWRWGLGGDRTPWYPSVRLFRQRALGGWQGVVEAMVGGLIGR
ncbi:MAG: glycosyltransferase family protein [Magnetococcales bacterium]|nr:glycosyltransferase family protein [Magnetococcales bacterium]